MIIETPTIIEQFILELFVIYILFYNFNISYKIKYILIHPLVPRMTGLPNSHPTSRKKWAAISARKIKPLDCYSCLVFWAAIAVCSFWTQDTIIKSAVHCVSVYMLALLIQKYTEK